MVNGCNIGPAVAMMSGYVQQEDLFISKLTVKETLTFQVRTRTRLPESRDGSRNHPGAAS